MGNVSLTHPASSTSPAGGAGRDELSDAQLLDRFTRDKDEAAFAALVRRHGPMVLGVCQRLLHHAQDAEDAFQATFMVLVRKARSLKQPESLAPWLYGVAFRTAQHARGRDARRSRHEREAASMPAVNSDPDSFAQDLRQLLDEELHRLPEKYRAPLVLCYLEGKTNAEAAQLLGWPTGSMSSRLARGRQMLRDRLAGRLRALPAALIPAFLSDHLRPAAVAPALAVATVNAALGLVGAKILAAGLMSSRVVELTEGALKALTPRRMFGLILAVLLAAGMGAAVCAAATGWPQRHPGAPVGATPCSSR